MGHSCDTSMVKHFLQTKPERKVQNCTQVLAKNDEIFHKCGQVTKPAESQLLEEANYHPNNRSPHLSDVNREKTSGSQKSRTTMMVSGNSKLDATNKSKGVQNG
ncbi:hypothetical protein G2W53_044515 [Senna tora]|uniref:Uncharacterized protein n=1 Tax=Senna tora TaxID=362788 RepID=A0A834SNR4_9FABA|nr:hypothetical protein G2W53_044515 [Senna tora]